MCLGTLPHNWRKSHWSCHQNCFVSFLFVFCTHCHRRCRPTRNINHRQHQRYLSFTASSLYIWTTAVPFFLVWCTNPSMSMNRFRTLQPGSQSKPFLSQHHCLFLEACIESKILQYSFEAVDVLALQCVFPSRSLWCSRVVFESKLKTSLFTLT